MTLTRHSLTIRIVVLAALAAGTTSRALAADLNAPLGTSELVADNFSGFALAGFDPVAYFSDGRARPGLAAHEVVTGVVAWRFASAANKTAFTAKPAVYAPRFGGHDAEAMSRGILVDADPQIFAVTNERLYIFRTAASRRRFLVDARLADDAEAAWRRIAAD